MFFLKNVRLLIQINHLCASTSFLCKQSTLICIILLVSRILFLPLLNKTNILLEYGNEGVDSQYE